MKLNKIEKIKKSEDKIKPKDLNKQINIYVYINI